MQYWQRMRRSTKGSVVWFLSVLLCVMGVSSCMALRVPPTIASAPAGDMCDRPLWQGDLSSQERWLDAWGAQARGSWGLENVSVQNTPEGRFNRVLRVRYPARSASPSVARRYRVPIGGAQFYADLGLSPQTSLRLSYDLRFSDNFDFVKGGKLPGFYGGEGASGGDNPDGTDGFSTRFMWRRRGDGEIYAYLPTTTDEYGTSIGRGNWRFRRGVWHHLEQEVVLNRPNADDGRIRVWFDERLVLDQGGLRFRTVDSLQLNGLFFSTFFGGNDRSWATPRNVYVDFANFAVFPGHCSR